MVNRLDEFGKVAGVAKDAAQTKGLHRFGLRLRELTVNRDRRKEGGIVIEQDGGGRLPLVVEHIPGAYPLVTARRDGDLLAVLALQEQVLDGPGALALLR